MRKCESYLQILSKASWSHEHGRNVEHICQEDIDIARLYSYAFRTQTIGAFHSTAVLLLESIAANASSLSDRYRVLEYLGQLRDRAMDPVPTDFRAVVSTFYYYHRWTEAAVERLESVCSSDRNPELERIKDRFKTSIERITSCNGIFTSSDEVVPEQATFRVPGLGIDIVPLLYGDHHSWNFAHLKQHSNGVPPHRHHLGAEIHLGYVPVEGRTILGQHCTEVHEGYAMPVPPMTTHGFQKMSAEEHLLPYVFGSLSLGGWGVFFDVEPVSASPSELIEVPLESEEMNNSLLLDKKIASLAQWSDTRREVLIPASSTGSVATGGLELGLAQIKNKALSLTSKDFRIVSINKGRARVRVGPAESEVAEHDHFGVPADTDAYIAPADSNPVVILDSMILKIS